MVKVEDTHLISNLGYMKELGECTRKIITETLAKEEANKIKNKKKMIPIFEEGTLEAIQNKNIRNEDMKNKEMETI